MSLPGHPPCPISPRRRASDPLDRRQAPRTSPRGRICEECKSIQALDRVSQPFLEPSTILRERPAQQLAMCREAPAVRVCVRDNRPAAHLVRIPAPCTTDFRRETAIPTDLSDEPGRIGQLRLDLEDREHPSLGMERQPIDHAPFAPDGVRDLGRGHPTGYTGDSCGQSFVEGRVSRTHDPFQTAAPPGRDEIEPDLEHGRHRQQGPHRKRAQMTPLDTRHRGLRDSGPARNVGLPQSKVNPDRAEHRAKLDVVHPTDDAERPSPPAYRAMPEPSHRARRHAQERRIAALPREPHTGRRDPGRSFGWSALTPCVRLRPGTLLAAADRSEDW